MVVASPSEMHWAMIAVPVVLVLIALIVTMVVVVKKKKKQRSNKNAGGGGGGAAAAGSDGWQVATQTWYSSYPACCKNSPGYDPKASITECRNFSGCKYQGMFMTGKKLSYEQVKSLRFCALYDIKQKSQWKGDKNPYWDAKYRDKYIWIRKKGDPSSAMKIQILDTCKDSDCGGCCSKNASKSPSGVLIDLEEWTAKAFFKTDKVPGMSQIEFKMA